MFKPGFNQFIRQRHHVVLARPSNTDPRNIRDKKRTDDLHSTQKVQNKNQDQNKNNNNTHNLYACDTRMHELNRQHEWTWWLLKNQNIRDRSREFTSIYD